MKHNIGILRNKGQKQFITFGTFFTACMVCTDSARLGKCLCPICVSGYCPGTFLFLPTDTICHRRLVHCAKHCRPASLPCLMRATSASRGGSRILLDRRQVSSMGVRMVLSGMGTELLAKELSTSGRAFPIPPTLLKTFRSFVDSYIENLNGSYTGITSIDKDAGRAMKAYGHTIKSVTR